MRKAGIILVALAIGFILGAGFWQQIYAERSFVDEKGNIYMGIAFIDGASYMKNNENFQLIYVCGVSDTLQAASLPHVLNPSDIEAFVRFTEKMKAGQIKAIVDKWMKEHPELWHFGMAHLVSVAVLGTCRKQSHP